MVSDIFGQGRERLQITFTEFCAHFISQGSHRLEKYLSLEGFLEKSLKINSALKSTGKSLNSLEKSMNSTIFFKTTTVDRDLNHYKIVVPLFQIKAHQFILIS